MKKLALTFIIAPALLLAGCYHAVINTGLAPGSKVINKHMRPSFIYGLIRPPAMNAEGRCPGGVARVETQHTFVEGLLAAVTGGIFTPMTYTITCATSSSMAPHAPTLDVGAALTPRPSPPRVRR
jgi:hypothetical protein